MSHPFPHHPKLRADWLRPIAPEGFDVLVCCDYNDGLQELDFVSSVRHDYASETPSLPKQPPLGWPWVDGFTPTPADWLAIGIGVINFGVADDIVAGG